MMSQIIRAGISVPSNVEEAPAAQSKADFISKMNIALKRGKPICACGFLQPRKLFLMPNFAND